MRPLALATLLLVGCNSAPPTASTSSSQAPVRAQARTLSAAEAREAIGRGAAVLDVRERDEAAGGMLASAQLAPSSELRDEARFKQLVASLPAGKPVVVYCAAGSRAGKIAQRLAQQGVDAANGGGYDDLAAAGLATKKP